ncbi:MAG: alpha-glucosidase [Lachnospiraceae bacterium]|nr:alpha-glucosidase [Lachnospiraceae bacterium]
MIRKFVLGDPIETESVVEDIERSNGTIPYWVINENEKTMTLAMDKDARVYGLGEQVRGMNKRGWHYVSYCADEPHHEEGKTSLYGAHNFFIYDPGCDGMAGRFGMYVDTPGAVEFDIGYEDHDEMRIIFKDFDANIYFIDGTSLSDIVKQFRRIIGQSYIAPRWAFGLGQSRWSYMNVDEVREVIDAYEKAKIPLDSVYLDIDYMERYKDFTINNDTFSGFDGFVSEMAQRKIHLIPIIDAGVKIEEGYDVYEEGIKGDHFVKDEDGKPFTAAVWPGRVHFPDFLKEDTRRWFGDKYKVLTDMGIDGFWNDMNEPAIFYSEKRLKECFNKIDGYKNENLDINSFFEFQGTVNGLNNSLEDHKSFYHEFKGKKIRHDKVHNLYGYNMTRAAGEAFSRIAPDKEILMFSRASYIGMHRYAGIWTGDNMSWWSHLLLSIHQLPGLNMCGFLYAGPDTGGFGCDVTEDLMIRWVSFSIFTPLFRNHSAMGTRRQELYRFKNTEVFKNLVGLRYALIPYLYSEYVWAAKNDEMLFKPLCFEYENDERAKDVEDQLFVGRSIMIAPVYTQNASGRYVYLPEDMKMIRLRSTEDYDEECLDAGDHFLRAEEGEVLVFVRKGRELPLAEPVLRTADLNDKAFKTIKY